jgi:hypothetical protein
VTARVFSDRPLNAYIFDGEGFARYQKAGITSTTPLSGSSERFDHQLTAILPPGAGWFLVLENPTGETASVSYEAVAEGYGGPSGATGVTGTTGSYGV